MLTNTNRRSGDVRFEKPTMAHEGIPWGTARSLLGTVDDEEFPEMCQRPIGVEVRDDLTMVR
jgi:hypothetical protein